MFTRSLSPVNERIELIKSQHYPHDVGEFIRHLKILVKDSAKKLQTSNGRQKAGWALRGVVAEPPGKDYQYLFSSPWTDSRSQCLTRIGTPHYPRVLSECILFEGLVRCLLCIRSSATHGLYKTPTRESPGGSDYTEHHGFAPGSKSARRGRGNLMPPLSNWCDRRRCRHARSEAG